MPLTLIRLSALHFNSSKRNENHLKHRHGRRDCEKQKRTLNLLCGLSRCLHSILEGYIRWYLKALL